MRKMKKEILKKICLSIFLALLFCFNVCAEETDKNELNSSNEKNILKVEQLNSVEYKITLSNVSLPEGTQFVTMPIWSEEKGQDDIKWYNAQRQSNGDYSTILKLTNHKALGNYCIDAYACTETGKYIYLNGKKVIIEKPKIPNVTISDYDIDKGTFRVSLAGLINADRIKYIQVPIWSEEKGQDDINWYMAKKDNQGNYYVDVDIKNHKYSMGIYDVDVYITDITGNMTFGGTTNQNINVECGSLVISPKSEKEYNIRLENVKIPGGNGLVQFPVWSEKNGQDDIRWCTAKKDSDGSYSFDVSVMNHKGLGKFIAHAYVKMPNNSMIYVGAGDFETKIPSIENAIVSVPDKASGKFRVKISGIENEELLKQIQVPIWSTTNQSDIIWYTATKNSNGDYIVNADISKHKYHCSEYKIDVYLTDVTGCMSFVKSMTCDMSPEYGELAVEDISGNESLFRVTLSDLIVPSGLKNLRFAVWGDLGGQNDIQWYYATRSSNDSYTYDIKIKNHKEPGSYNIHVYCTAMNDSLQYIGATTFEVVKKPTIAQIQISDVDGTAGTFKVTVSGVMAPSGVDKVQIPVWCEDNQSDIVWYNAAKVSEGVYTVTAKVSNHAHHFGTYKADVYITMGNGIRCFAGSNTALIKPLNYVYTRSLSSTRQEVGIMGVSNATSVQFPTWSNTNGQDDIIWYNGTNQGDGKWSVVVDSAKHNSGGTYTTHVYATVNGSLTCVGNTSYSLTKVPTAMSNMILKANIYSSNTPYLILVNRSTHKVAVFQGRQGNWNCIQYWDCADGAPSTPTVEGIFRVGIRGYYFDSGASRCYWYTQFRGNYLFHSVLYNKNGTLRDGRVGMPLSHGCVRLQIQNAKWIYDNIPAGTTVVVYH